MGRPGNEVKSDSPHSFELTPRLDIVFLISHSLCLPLLPSSPLQLAAEVGALAVSHLEHVTATGIEAMAQAEVVGVLLPTTAYILHLQPPPAREMIKKGTTPNHTN